MGFYELDHVREWESTSRVADCRRHWMLSLAMEQHERNLMSSELHELW